MCTVLSCLRLSPTPVLSTEPLIKGVPKALQKHHFSSRRSVVIQDAGNSRVNPLIPIKNKFYVGLLFI